MDGSPVPSPPNIRRGGAPSSSSSFSWEAEVEHPRAPNTPNLAVQPLVTSAALALEIAVKNLVPLPTSPSPVVAFVQNLLAAQQQQGGGDAVEAEEGTRGERRLTGVPRVRYYSNAYPVRSDYDYNDTVIGDNGEVRSYNSYNNTGDDYPYGRDDELPYGDPPPTTRRVYVYGGSNAEYNMGYYAGYRALHGTSSDLAQRRGGDYYVGFLEGYRWRWSRNPRQGDVVAVSDNEHPGEHGQYLGPNTNEFYGEGYYYGYYAERGQYVAPELETNPGLGNIAQFNYGYTDGYRRRWGSS